MDYKIFIIKGLAIAATILVFFKLDKKANISKYFARQFKIITKFRAFIFYVAVYALLTLTTTIIQYSLSIPNLIIEIVDRSIQVFTFILFFEIIKDIPSNDKSWLG